MTLLKFSANLSWLYPEIPFLMRFHRARKAGFRGVECTFPYEIEEGALGNELRAHDLAQVLINAPPGNWSRGDRGLAGLPDRREEFLASLDVARRYANELRCPFVHVLAGCRSQGADRYTYKENLKRAVDMLGQVGAQPLVEVLNGRDVPGYLIDHPDIACELVDQVPGLGLQADLYHLQITRGDITSFLRENIGVIRHVQVAGVPDRGEPNRGELNIHHCLNVLSDLGYSGWIGCEYSPQRSDDDGLSWVH